MIRKLKMSGKNLFSKLADGFFSKATKYLEDRFDYNNKMFYGIESLNLFEMKPIQWSDMAELCIKAGLAIDQDKLYVDISRFNSLIDKIPAELPVDKKWSYFFEREKQCEELLKVISFCIINSSK